MRLKLLLICIIISSCSNYNKNLSYLNETEVPRVFYSSKMQDSLYCFINSVDSLCGYPAEFLIEIHNEQKDTFITMRAEINIGPSWELNATDRRIIKDYYYPQGGIIINNKPILVRSLNDIEIHNIIDTTSLDKELGILIDSLIVDSEYEPWGYRTMKIYQVHGDSLTILHRDYLGKTLINKISFTKLY